jgi:hypothetical protein
MFGASLLAAVAMSAPNDQGAATEAAAEPKTPKTLEERLTSARALVAKIEGQIRERDMLNNVQEGDRVTFSYGRAEKTRELSGTVLSIRDDEKMGRQALIQSGEGFDIQNYKVRVADILTNVTADERNASEAEVEADQTEGTDADPLAAE